MTGIPGIVKPLPSEWFIRHDTNAEMRWDTLGENRFLTPVQRFFVRNHTVTPLIAPDSWRLRVFGTGLRGSAVEFGLAELLRLPAAECTAVLECAGNGRSYYHAQQNRPVPGTPWKLGGIGAARWRGVRLADVLRAAGIGPRTVAVMPVGLDPVYVVDGVDYGHVRRPLPIAKAMDDVLLAYEMNGEPLPPDHGGPARLVVPGWVGIASIKWIGSLEVSAEPLHSPWDTEFYRMFGPEHPPGGGEPLTRQVVKCVFELPPEAELTSGRRYRLAGRAWSGHAPVRAVEVSTDDGERWQPARLRDEPWADNWTRWTFDWEPARAGRYRLRARATDRAGNTQPVTEPFNREGYLFGAVVAHPVTVH